MKKLMRSVSLLLAGLMTMALFTACDSADTPVSPEELGEQYVQTYLEGFNLIRTAGDLPNDPTLEAMCLSLLDNIDPETCTVGHSESYIEEPVSDHPGFYVRVSISTTGRYDSDTGNVHPAVVSESSIYARKSYYENRAAENSDELIQAYNDCLGIAAAYKVIDGKAYVATARISDNRI